MIPHWSHLARHSTGGFGFEAAFTRTLAALLLAATLTAVPAAAARGARAPDPVIPNDPYFERQISYHNTGGEIEMDMFSNSKRQVALTPDPSIHHNLAMAWSLSTGSKDVIVAVLDDGFSYGHEDISENIWENPGETGLDEFGHTKQANGIDDDGNGYVDDVIGWDFAFDDPDPDAYSFDGRDETTIAVYWHSIGALGIIGARGNNGIGVAGINWDVSLMPLKTCAQASTISRRAENTTMAIRYAVDNGARIINWSGGVSISDSTSMRQLDEAITYAGENGVLLVVAAGNSRKNRDLEENYVYPTCFPHDNIIAVAEVDFDGTLYVVPEGSKYIGGSDYGVRNVDIGAIAQNYTTSIRHNVSTYGIGGGTSSAAPVVSGVAALVLSVRPDLSGADVKEILLESSKKLPDLEGRIGCGGMVDAHAALVLAQEW